MDRRLTIALLIGNLALATTAAHAAGSDPHAKKADAHPAKPAAHAPAAKAEAHAPAAKAAAHASTPKAEAHAPKAEAETHAPKADAHAPKAPAAKAAPAAGGKPAATDLHALKERIQERVAEVRKTQLAAKPRERPAGEAPPGLPERLSAVPQSTSGRSAAHSAERVRVVWKISVAWPEELQPREGTATSGNERVSVSWPKPEGLGPGPRP